MKYKGPMLVVKDIEKSKDFYRSILKLRVISDLGVNVTLTGGLSLQTEESWCCFTGCQPDSFRYRGNDVEFYFEEEDFDGFIQGIRHAEVETIGDVTVMPWGQRIIRFYDPDKHVIEVGEEITAVIKRMDKEGMTIDEIAEKTYMKTGVIKRMLESS